jgi:hypothetical protein
VSEVNPDPVAQLGRFTPVAATDPAELLFAAGRASARTHWGWKVAVAALVASNVALGALFVLHTRPAPPTAQPAPAPVDQQPPELSAPAPPTSTPEPVDEPWSYRALRSADLERAPLVDGTTTVAPREPLTVRSGQRGELD